MQLCLPTWTLSRQSWPFSSSCVISLSTYQRQFARSWQRPHGDHRSSTITGHCRWWVQSVASPWLCSHPLEKRSLLSSLQVWSTVWSLTLVLKKNGVTLSRESPCQWHWVPSDGMVTTSLLTLKTGDHKYFSWTNSTMKPSSSTHNFCVSKTESNLSFYFLFSLCWLSERRQGIADREDNYWEKLRKLDGNWPRSHYWNS